MESWYPIRQIVRFDVLLNYDRYQDLNKAANPQNVLLPGCVQHVVAQNDQNGLTMIDLWEDEAKAMPYYEGFAKAVNMPLPQLTISHVFEVLCAAHAGRTWSSPCGATR